MRVHFSKAQVLKMVSIIVGIEFDQHVFNTEVKCEQWLRSKPEFQFLIANKKWRLKTIARSIWMSLEGRKVFAWHGPFYQCKDLHLERPDPYVLVIYRASSSFFSEIDLPVLSPRAQKRKRDSQIQQEIRDKARLERKEKALSKKKARNLLNKKPTFPDTTAEILTGNKDNKENSTKRKTRPRKKVKKEEKKQETEVVKIETTLDDLTDLNIPLAPLDNDELNIITGGFTTRVDTV